ncbi:membrane protein [Erwinia mallotivora]|uniref:Membrane protein n=2 Tax=Erwinia mallotivora TaxID=69222 RepID=A0A014PYQ5_9GAMM|nr:membrane protein [Erwinia mallotivora]
MISCTALLLLTAGVLLFFYNDKRSVKVIDAHYDGSSVQVIVDRLPFTEEKKIKWWSSNQDGIRQKYHIPSDSSGPFLIFIYQFGKGYQEEGKKDRACFKDISSPKNCLDKNILMTIWRTREGSVKYDF